MTSIELYVYKKKTCTKLSIDTTSTKRKSFQILRGWNSGRDRQDYNVTSTQKMKKHDELKMLCEHGIGDENLITLAKSVYCTIVELDERPMQKIWVKAVLSATGRGIFLKEADNLYYQRNFCEIWSNASFLVTNCR